VLELMHFADEIIPAGELHVPGDTKIGKKEADMAKQLVASMSSKWEPKNYKDDYKEALLDVIEKKAASGGKAIKTKKARNARPTNVIDLVSVLKKSLQQHGGGASSKKKSPAKSRRRAA
jgi:DNA end-binding protein Ku